MSEQRTAGKQITDVHRGISDHDACVRNTQLVLNLPSDVEALLDQKAAICDFACKQTHGAKAPELVRDPDPITKLPIQSEAFLIEGDRLRPVRLVKGCVAQTAESLGSLCDVPDGSKNRKTLAAQSICATVLAQTENGVAQSPQASSLDAAVSR